MKNITKHFIFGLAIIGPFISLDQIAATQVIYDSTRSSRIRTPRRRVVYERRRGSRAGNVLAPAATGAIIGGIAGGGRGAGIGAGVGLGLGLLGSRRPRYREVVYEYDDPIDDDFELEDIE